MKRNRAKARGISRTSRTALTVRCPRISEREVRPRCRAVRCSPKSAEYGAERRPSSNGTGLKALATAGEGDDFSIIAAIGGVRGVVESMLPGVVFVVLFVVTQNLDLSPSGSPRPWPWLKWFFGCCNASP